MAEFLPLCDVLFNIISLAGYFCDVVFDLVMGYALLERGYKCTFAATISIVITSLLISQVLSLRWYLHVWWASEGRKDRPPWLPIVLHCLQMGVLWRYARLLVPVELRRVKHQVRDLCMLRLVHAFCEAAPMLLLQLHILLKDADLESTSELVGVTPEPTVDEPSANKAFAELNVISASLSLFSVCWALASFSKNVRLQNVHRLVLTWLGVIFQFLWRLGTVSARIWALSVYALVYEYWVFLVIGLHWVSMFLWLISPKNVFHGEHISRPRKAYLSALIAFVYVFAYINLQEHNHRQKMVVFYCVMCVENGVLVTAWWWSWRGALRPALAAAGAAAAGLACMLLYYRYFHVRRLGYMLGEHQQGTNSTNASSQNKNGKPSQTDNAAIPGVFNCRFSNPVNNSAAACRKKKKPTSFVPPPAAPAPAAPPAAFWRRPLPAHHHHGGSSENEGSSVGSRVNIQQKLQEKKQKQLAELRVIEEEIKQGKLAKTTPVAAEEIYSSLQRQPIPRAKTHAEPPAWPSIEMTHSYQNYPVLPHTCNMYSTYTELKPEYNVPNFQNNENSTTDMRAQNMYNQDSRTFYENPSNLRNEINRTPLRSPNYLAIGENRKYESNVCRSPRNVLNSSPRNYLPDVSANNYEATAQNNTRIPAQNNQKIYSEDRQNMTDFSGYCEENAQNVYNKFGENKEEYVSALQSLANVQGMENIRGIYNEVGNCNQYNHNCERIFPYPGLGGKKMEQLRKIQRCRTPEILLAPHYLESCNRQVCCNWGGPYSNRKKEDTGPGGGAGGAAGGASSGSDSPDARDTPRPPSDIDSQISLPRSYTLPREFRYWRRRPRLRDAHVPSNNSSDGDVDSADNDSDNRSNCSASSQIQPPTYGDSFQYRPDMRQDERYNEGVYACPDRRRRGFRKQGPKPETKL
ncbi:uncharacterized protein LOC123665465 [Melitaea cinxia]|uniref:uncharacterized protein LOC123665465 n=1 Tax=Melitaea cinxia TaxID=113334 RepID=UPI001E2708F4|nr:uncharacterized protein LOC123665465 [Melitaea cinxia]